MSKHLHLLIVEDRSSDVELAVFELRRNGFEVDYTVAQTESEYRKELSANLDLIICDHHLPQFDSTRALVILNESGLDVPFIVVSGTISEELAVETMRHGAADYLIKDRLARLGPAVDHALEQRKLKRQNRQAQEALRLSEEFNRRIVENSLDCIQVLDLDGKLLSVNDGGQKVLEIGDFETYRDVYWPSLWGGDFTELAGEAVSQARCGQTYRFQGNCPSSSGKSIWWDVIATPIRDSDGSVDRILVVSRDITEQKRIESAIAEASALSRSIEARLRFALEVAELGEWSLDLTTNKAERSLRHDQIFGYDKLLPEWTYEKFISHVVAEDRQKVDESFRRALEGELWDIECRIIRADQAERWIWGRGQVQTSGDGHSKLMQGLIADITERKKLEGELRRAKEAAEDASRAKSAFLANMSHEIRTPLGAILGFSELLIDENVSDDDRQEFVSTIKRNGRLLTQIIDDILDLSKVEAGRLTVEENACSLPQVIAEITSTFQNAARLKGLYLKVSSDGDIPETITTDPTRLKQVLINIIGNAIKFTAEGGIDVCLRLNPRGLNQRKQLQVIVKDTGCGISASQKKRLFQPFSQADESTTRVFGGTGLGLILSQRLAEALGGSLDLTESELGVGSTFTITIDPGATAGTFRISGHDHRSPDANRTNEVQHRELSGMDILVVEDSADNQQLIQMMLMRSGANVELANDGEEAVRKAMKSDYDAVLMDLQMPIKDGFEATAELRRLGYDKPILALSAAAMAQEIDRALSVGCNGHLSKPINFRDLVRAIQKYVGEVDRFDTTHPE